MLVIEVTATASVGVIMAPRAKAKANGMLGIIRCVTKPTAMIERIANSTDKEKVVPN
ncbi:hypothetical protein LCR01_05120 [Companilactobacillus crustorum]|uniref:Uncharacterized protein n=1 Tax=Companilactobacillus crustorum TaxID=392416 RepID=A0AB34A9F9_9LACO|nr:hypothetical protein LCR01_05120 [Companilactobacillus crustorum]